MVLELNQKCQLSDTQNKALESTIAAHTDEIEALSGKLAKYEAQYERVSMEREEYEHLLSEKQRECDHEKERGEKLIELEQERYALREQLSVLRQQMKQRDAEHTADAVSVTAD